MLPRPPSVFDDLPQPAGTGVTYDGSTMSEYDGVAIRIGSKVFMPDEPLAIKVIGWYNQLRCRSYYYLEVLKDDELAFQKLQDVVKGIPDMKVSSYNIRTRLTYSPAEERGTAGKALVKMTGKREGDELHEEIYFLSLAGAPAKPIDLVVTN